MKKIFFLLSFAVAATLHTYSQNLPVDEISDQISLNKFILQNLEINDTDGVELLSYSCIIKKLNNPRLIELTWRKSAEDDLVYRVVSRLNPEDKVWFDHILIKHKDGTQKTYSLTLEVK